MNQKPNPAAMSSSTGTSIGTSPSSSYGGIKSGGDPVVNAAVDAGRDLARDAKHLASDVVAEAKHTADSRLSSSKDRAADTLNTVADALRHTGNHLQLQHEGGSISGYVGQAADQVERASNYLQTRTLGELVEDVEQFARREPALFLGGAFVAGLVGGRFLKSSAPQRKGRSSASDNGSLQASTPLRRPGDYGTTKSPTQGASVQSPAKPQPPPPPKPSQGGGQGHAAAGGHETVRGGSPSGTQSTTNPSAPHATPSHSDTLPNGQAGARTGSNGPKAPGSV